ncbi:unnamed protein product [Phytophthora fragariaefolia]|uniref:Unnamed protein product n=1 Tax=Phytophthora fragariaefolia TaxID=1490495 RepID=A0A9W6XL93_9STRA|nr:unnamed protein product [Phytophthora fragariaefolia]
MSEQGKFRRFHNSLFKAKATAPFSSEAVAAALQENLEAECKDAASVTLEKEISSIIDAIAADVQTAIDELVVL